MHENIYLSLKMYEIYLLTFTFFMLLPIDAEDPYGDGRLFFVEDNMECQDPNAYACARIRFQGFSLLRDRIYIDKPGYGKMWFERVLKYKIHNEDLLDFKAIDENGNDVHGYLTLVKGSTTGLYFGFIEYDYIRLSFKKTTEGHLGPGELISWHKSSSWYPETNQGRKFHKANNDYEGDQIPDFPYFYHAIKWTYKTHPDWTDDYKYMLWKGVRMDSEYYVNVTITFLFTGSSFRHLAIGSPMVAQMLIAFFIRQFNYVMKTSGIKINFKAHCADFVDEKNLNITMKDAYGQDIEISAENDLDALLNFYNQKRGESGSPARARSFASDITIIFRDDIGDRYGLAPDWGIQYGQTAIFIKQDFALRRYDILHEIGHIIGCSHEVIYGKETIRAPPAIFFAQSYVMDNNYCGLMSDPVNRTCRVGPFFANPMIKFKGSKAGTYYANNAMWMNHNRFYLRMQGDERLECRAEYLFLNSAVINCFLRSNESIVDCGMATWLWGQGIFPSYDA